MSKPNPSDVDGYIEAASRAAQPLLRELRRIILSSAAGATEKISYGMPTYELGGQRLAHFAAAKTHVGVYGLVHVEAEVPEELAGHLDHRSTLRFRFDHPLPRAALAAAVRRKAESIKGDRRSIS